jgi:four helix bundle protein
VGECPERAETENEMTLKIQDDILQLIRELRPTLDEIARHDGDLHRQIKRALSSIALNTAEARWRDNGNGRQRFETAMGSANESHGCLRTADAFGYVEVDAKHLDTLDRIARSLNKLR